jgi:hypothetical protein
MPRILLAVLLLSSLAVQAQTQIYRTTDKDGNTVFTDAPPADSQGTEQVEVPPPNTAPPPADIPSLAPTPKPAAPAAPEVSVAIVSPANETTIPMGPGNFTVQAETSQVSGADLQLQLFMDGVPMGEPQRGSRWDLTNVFRGAHDLTVSVVDAGGNPLASSEPVRVYVLRPSSNFR